MTIPGLILPTAKSYPPGAGTPRDAALMTQQTSNESQNNLNKFVGGKKHKKHKNCSKGGSNIPTQTTLPAPQFQMLYQPQGGPGTNPNNQITELSATSTQAATWKQHDNLAEIKKGGSKKRRCVNLNLLCRRENSRRQLKRRKSRKNKNKRI